MPNFLYGMHDPGGEHLMPKGSWVVHTESIGHDPNNQDGKDFRRWSQQGYNVLVRLNNGYGSDGTLPTGEHYDDFARRCANYVRNSPGATRWIIGNEPNHNQEWPQGQIITSREYARAFLLARMAIRSVGNQHQVLTAAVAPWNVQSGDWLKYQYDFLERIGRNAEGITLHTYTHGTDPALISSNDKMDAPYQNRHYHFRAYRDMLEQVPTSARHLPVYITETDQDVPWADTNSGWVQRAYAEIQLWNQTSNTQKIQCLVLYRWPDYDQWAIIHKQGVQNDLKDAALAQYKSPALDAIPVAPDVPVTTPPPSLPPSTLPPVGTTTLPPISFDPLLTQRGVEVEHPAVSPGGRYWRLVNADYRTAEEFGGRHHIYVDVIDENGVRLVGQKIEIHNGGTAVLTTEAKPGEEAAANFPMYASGHSYDASVVGLPSDKVTGMGLGTVEEPHVGHHVSYFLVWQRAKAQEAVTTPPTPTQPPVTQPIPPTQPPPTEGSRAFRLPLDTLTVTQWWGRAHGGIDYSCTVGTPVKASADGVVAIVDTDTAANGGYGKYIRVYHEQLGIHTFYAHLSEQRVEVGDTVKFGQVIGLSGNTGNSTGPHLHYELRLAAGLHTYDRAAAGETYNARVDPMAWQHGHKSIR